MSEHVYKTIELVGSSQKGIEDAIERALERGARTVRKMRWFEVVETRGTVDENQVGYWQVTLKVGFTLDE